MPQPWTAEHAVDERPARELLAAKLPQLHGDRVNQGELRRRC